MNQTSDHELKVGKEAYLAAMAAYAIIRTTNLAQVRRAELRQGEVKAEPIDFVCDIEVRVKKTLNDRNELILWWNILEEPDRYPELPEYLQELLGNAFIEHRMGVDGDYRQLYFKLKNQSDRRRFHGTGDSDSGGGKRGSKEGVGIGYEGGDSETETAFP